MAEQYFEVGAEQRMANDTGGNGMEERNGEINDWTKTIMIAWASASEEFETISFQR